MHYTTHRVFIYVAFIICLIATAGHTKNFSCVDDLALKSGFNGTLAVKYKDEVLFANSYGNIHHEKDLPCEKTSLFRIASVTKQFTAASILLLQEKGLLNVHDPINKFLPNYPNGEKITLHHLLTNTSGIWNYTKNKNPSLEVLLGGLSVERLIEQFRDEPLLFEPGEKYSYSNSGYILLGAIIEKISGQPYEKFIHEHILSKIGMKNTRYKTDSTRLAGEAIGYTMNDDGQIIKALNIHNSLAFSSGGLSSTVDDLLIWSAALKNSSILTAESLHDMQTCYVQKHNSPTSFYGYGVEIEILNPSPLRRKIWHSGSILGFQSSFSQYIEDDITIVILSNHDFSKDIIHQIEEKLLSIVTSE